MNENPSLHQVHFDELAIAALQQLLALNHYSSVFVLVDENTEKYCLDLFKDKLSVTNLKVIQIRSGEVHKNLQSCSAVWNFLSYEGGDRKSLLFNLGGGVITDLGGFVASTFKRGIDFVNVPTTLLAMVDAAIGGKNGIDFESLKNQIGVINQPKLVAIFPEFLKTLESRQIKSGFAEMLKHGLIQDAEYWKSLKELGDLEEVGYCIPQSVQIKSQVVQQDLNENGLRKILNFGHTLGHAVESYFLQNPAKKTLLHGEAIAIGMVLEAYLSHNLTGLSKVELQEITEVLHSFYGKIDFSLEDQEQIMTLLKHDKKNTHGEVNFVLLKSIGKSAIDIKVPAKFLPEAFEYYSNN